MSQDSAPTPTTPGATLSLHPAIKAALESLDLDFEQELARFRHFKATTALAGSQLRPAAQPILGRPIPPAMTRSPEFNPFSSTSIPTPPTSTDAPAALTFESPVNGETGIVAIADKRDANELSTEPVLTPDESEHIPELTAISDVIAIPNQEHGVTIPALESSTEPIPFSSLDASIMPTMESGPANEWLSEEMASDQFTVEASGFDEPMIDQPIFDPVIESYLESNEFEVEPDELIEPHQQQSFGASFESSEAELDATPVFKPAPTTEELPIPDQYSSDAESESLDQLRPTEVADQNRESGSRPTVNVTGDASDYPESIPVFNEVVARNQVDLVPPNDYYESSENLLRSLEESEQLDNQTQQQSDSLLWPVMVGAFLALFVAGGAFAYLILYPHFSSPTSQQSRVRLNPLNAARLPMTPNLAASEFQDFKTVSLAALSSGSIPAYSTSSESVTVQNAAIANQGGITSSLPSALPAIAWPESSPTPITARSSKRKRGFYYVVLPQSGLDTLAQVQQIVPDAFLDQFGEATHIQLGAFYEDTQAQILVQELQQNGISAQIYSPQ
jgi:hypothetical protein